MIDIFRKARRVSAPIIAINTTDPIAVVSTLRETYGKAPLVEWNSVAGVRPLNAAGKQSIDRASEATSVIPESSTNIMEAVRMFTGFSESTIVFVHNAHRWLPGAQEDPMRSVVAQGIANLRELYKADRRTLVMLAQAIVLPDELAADTVVIDDRLPNPEELAAIVTEQFEAADLPKPSPEVLAKAVDAVAGLASFPAEQVVAMSLTPEGIDLQMLWERKRQTISQTPGLSVNKSGEKFEDVGGCGNVKGLLSRVIGGKRPPRAIVWLDEIEKALSGAGGDTSGTSQDQLGQILTYMQDANATGVIFIGLPGSAKSLIAKSLGNEAGVPTIQFDLGGMKGSLVGQSEARVRQALKVVTAVGQGRVFFVATCNSIGALPPELRRRFKLGTFFFDVPTREERDAIWDLYLRKSGLKFTPDNPRPADDDWSGAEIAACVENVDLYGMTFEESASYIVPVARAMGAQLESLRALADGKFLSAAHAGLYNKEARRMSSDEQAIDMAPRKRRKIGE